MLLAKAPTIITTQGVPSLIIDIIEPPQLSAHVGALRRGLEFVENPAGAK